MDFLGRAEPIDEDMVSLVGLINERLPDGVDPIDLHDVQHANM